MTQIPLPMAKNWRRMGWGGGSHNGPLSHLHHSCTPPDVRLWHDSTVTLPCMVTQNIHQAGHLQTGRDNPFHVHTYISCWGSERQPPSLESILTSSPLHTNIPPYPAGVRCLYDEGGNQCRWDFGLVSGLPIGVTFEPQNIPTSNHPGNYVRDKLGDSNGTIYIPIPILEGEIWNLPGFCLPILSRQCWWFRPCIIYCQKDLFNWNTAPLRLWSWEVAQWRQRYSRIKLDRARSGRLCLVSLISSLPPYGTSSSLISTESYSRGASNRSCIMTWGSILTEDIGNYRNCTTQTKLSILVSSKSGPSFPFVPPSSEYVLLHFLAAGSGIWVILR